MLPMTSFEDFQQAVADEEAAWAETVKQEELCGPKVGEYLPSDSDYKVLHQHVSMAGIAYVGQHERTQAAMFEYQWEGIGFRFSLWSEVGELARSLFLGLWDKYRIDGETDDHIVSDRIVRNRKKKATKRK